MGRGPSHCLTSLGDDLRAQRLLLGVGRARDEEVLPDEQPCLVTVPVEVFALVDAAAPDPDQVAPGGRGLVVARGIPLGGDPGGEAVVGDPVDPADEDRRVVDEQPEGC